MINITMSDILTQNYDILMSRVNLLIFEKQVDVRDIPINYRNVIIRSQQMEQINNSDWYTGTADKISSMNEIYMSLFAMFGCS